MIAHWNHAPSGCYWYRIKRPMDTLAKHGYPTIRLGIDTDIDESLINDIKSLQVYGIYPFSFNKVLQYFKEKGVKIVYDLDDALDLIETSNPFYYNVKKDANSERELFKIADHITVSTEAMKEYVQVRTNKPITVIPNCYTPEEWDFPHKEHTRLRIGFAGSTTHVEDLLEVLPAIIELKKKYDFDFILYGFAQTDYPTWFNSFQHVCTPEALKHLVEFDKLISQLKFEWVPFTEFSLFPQTLINLNLDIGLCPLKDTPFNRSRSASKAMEYTLSGSLAISSPIRAYEDPTVIRTNNWYETLEYYILNPSERITKHQEHLQWIKDNRDTNKMIDLLKSVYIV